MEQYIHTEYITRAPIGSVLPADTVAQRFGCDLLVVVLHLLSDPSCRREVGASWTDVAFTLVAGIGDRYRGRDGWSGCLSVAFGGDGTRIGTAGL